MEIQKECKIMKRLVLTIFIICMSGCSVIRKKQDICGTHFEACLGGGIILTLNKDSTFIYNNKRDFDLFYGEVTCTGTWSIYNHEDLVCDCTKNHGTDSDSMLCIENVNSDYHYVDLSGETHYVETRFKIKHGYITSGYKKNNHAFKLKRIKTAAKLKRIKTSYRL